MRVPAIVIVTAYDKFALQAFEAGAIDYLLKPVGHARLAEALERVKRLSGRETIERLARLQDIADPAAGLQKKALSENPTERPLLRSFLHPLNREELDVGYGHPLGLQ